MSEDNQKRADVTVSINKPVDHRVSPNLLAMGQIAAGIAHEINTPAQYVSDNFFFLQDAFDGILKVIDRYYDLYQAVKKGSVPLKIIHALEICQQDEDLEYLLEQVPEAIQQSMEGMTRITQIVEAMRDFSHPGLMEKKWADINKAIRDTVIVTRNIWKYCADMETDLDESLPSISCLPGEINQVFLNLIVNAADAVTAAIDGVAETAKGKIRISTRKLDTQIEIKIADTGTGIPEPVQNKIFDPFFTTKPVGKGTGQGLAIAASVIAQHGGSLSFDTKPGCGTTFHIFLPLEKMDANQA